MTPWGRKSSGWTVTYSLQDTDCPLNMDLPGAGELDESVRDILGSDGKVFLEILSRDESVLHRLFRVSCCLSPTREISLIYSKAVS